MSAELRRALTQVARRFKQVRLLSALAICWLAWALAGLCLWLIGDSHGHTLISDRLLFASLGIAAGTGIACAIAAIRSVGDARWVARRIEAKHPELATGLLAAVQEIESAPSGSLGFLQSAVVRKVLQHRHTKNWDETVPSTSLRLTQVAHAATLSLLVVVTIALVTQAKSEAETQSAGISEVDAADVQVDPGNTEIEQGTSLLVVARFHGGVPPEAKLIAEDQSRNASEYPMTRSLEDPTFAGRVDSVETDVSYRIGFLGQTTNAFQVHVFQYPELERADARLKFPGYTSLEPKTLEDIRHITAVEGTELTLLFRLNKEVAAARLIDKEGQAISLSPSDQLKTIYSTTLTLAEPRRFRLDLHDRDGRTNKLPTEIVINVTRNRPALAKIVRPGRDVPVSPIEELKLEAEMEDDFGIVRHGLSYSMAGQESREIVLTTPSTKPRQIHPAYTLDFESLKAAPDQLLTYFFWAEDTGPDGQPRRTSSDMYFAEVRPFEEILRQGEQPSSNSAENDQSDQQGNAQASDHLAELQKEIINGTWRLIRREINAKPSAKLLDDRKVLEESQQRAIEQTNQLSSRLQDATSKANLAQAIRAMADAKNHLRSVTRSSDIAGLSPALATEQAAYQALLKLRAREIQVIRGDRQQRQAGQNAGNRSQRQLQELELAEDENRFEEQRTARTQQEQLTKQQQQQRESRQVLNRLRELAQRQDDVNKRLKELQSALQADKIQPDRDEIERQLKRLRDQQQQILRDTDELRERMEREENRDQMADARQQIDESREHVRQASRALEQSRVPEALTEGARAGRQFNDLREELRKRSANRFTQEMTGMRDQARHLDQDQKKLTDQLYANKDRPQTSLRDTGDRKKATEGLAQQRDKLDKLLGQMRNTVADAEETEPLLAKNLYDTVRKANEQKIPDALKAAEQLAELGIGEDAAKAARHASQGIEQIREGVERSAKSVLGDEAAALRRAQGELEDLANQVNQEIARATGQEPAPPSRRNSSGQTSLQDRTGSQPADPFDGIEMRNVGEQEEQQRQQGQIPDSESQSGRETRRDQGPRQDGKPSQRRDRSQSREKQPPGQGGPSQQPRPQPEGQQNEPARDQEQGEQQPGQPQRQGGNAPQSRQGQRGSGQQARPQPGSLRGNNAIGQDRQQQQIDGGPGGPGNPITGEGFRQWSDRMRDVEELIDNPELRAEAAQIRDRARGARDEFKRHAKTPDWNQLRTLVTEPINELRDRIAEEVRRRESPDALVPIDRDPVPPQFSESVRRYYERLGSGQ